MTEQLEQYVRTLDDESATRTLAAVRGTLEALRRDIRALNDTPETREILRRVDAYLAHLDAERARIRGDAPFSSVA